VGSDPDEFLQAVKLAAIHPPRHSA
jgi:hypothetical protein